jgi:hypothetical protein
MRPQGCRHGSRAAFQRPQRGSFSLCDCSLHGCRDLKPANVLLNGADSDTPAVKLGDFGLSRIQAVTMPTLNPEAGTVCGWGAQIVIVAM